MITHERWLRIQALCEALEAVPPHAHAQTLAVLEPEPQVRADTLALLAAMAGEERAQQIHAAARAALPAQPHAIAGYRIVERLGVGGSGEVFRAIRTVNGIEHAVALKRFHPHRSGREQVARFAREQQMLSALTHPDIVHFIDAGLTDDGRPFLVMDLAEGEPINAYCDRQRLKLPERLRLMNAVCDAVQGAHRQLIVHLDLKPSNILVTAERRIKLLDFGTAKLVDHDLNVTTTRSLTLLYASPEQLRGEPVSVACDIYSLGLILYELASGAWPFRRPDSIISVAERAVGHVEPLPLAQQASAEAAGARSTTTERLRQWLRGDLDAICAKALAPDPARRYASVAELAEDLRRFQSGEPVRAHAMSRGYRLRKFIGRHGWVVAAVVGLVVGLSAAAIYSVSQAEAARRAAARSEAANGFLTNLFTLSDRGSPTSREMTVRELLSLAEARIAPQFGSDPVMTADIENSLADGFVNQGDFAKAESVYSRALARAVSVGDVRRQATASAGLGYVRYLLNRTDEAWADSVAALALWKEHRAQFPPSHAANLLAKAAATLSYVRPTDQVYREYFDACLTLSAAHLREITPNDRARCLLGMATSYTIVDSRYDDAEPLLRQAIDIQRADPLSTAALSTTLQMHGLVNRYRGKFEDDERSQREATAIADQLFGAGTMTAEWQRAVWIASLIGVNRRQDAYRASAANVRAARSLVPTPGSYMLWTPLFSAMSAACLTGHFDECEALAQEAIQTLGPSPSPTDSRLASARGFLGLAFAKQGRCHEAKSLIEEAIAMHRARRRVMAYAAEFEAAIVACRSSK